MSLSLNDCNFTNFIQKLVALAITAKPVSVDISLGKNELGVFTWRHQNSNYFSKKLLIILSFSFHEVLQQLKTSIYTNFRFQRGLRFAIGSYRKILGVDPIDFRKHVKVSALYFSPACNVNDLCDQHDRELTKVQLKHMLHCWKHA